MATAAPAPISSADFEAAIPFVETSDEEKARNVDLMDRAVVVRDDGTRDGFRRTQRQLRVAALRNELGSLKRDSRDDPAREATRQRRIGEVLDELHLYARGDELDGIDDQPEVDSPSRARRGRGKVTDPPADDTEPTA